MRFVVCSCLALLLLATPAAAQPGNGGTAPVDSASSGGSAPTKTAKSSAKRHSARTPAAAPATVAPAPGATASLIDGVAHSPAGSPAAVKNVLRAGNKLQGFPYRYGGGHDDFSDDAYDCSGTVSFALHGAGLVDEPMDSSGLMDWGEAGEGQWITVYANADHTYLVVAGLRLDTSATNDPAGESGPRWRPAPRPADGFVARHPPGL